MIHLDTSFLIRALVQDSPQDAQLRAWLATGERLAMSVIAWSEFLCGPVEPASVELVAQIVSRRVPFGEEEAVLAAELFNGSGRRRGSMIDCMIAASAIRADATLAIQNPSDFRRLEATGLRVVSA